MRLYALALTVAAAARPQPCADERDSDTFKFKLYDDVSVTYGLRRGEDLRAPRAQPGER